MTDTWDGGGADNNLTTAANWVDNTTPVSDIVNTDLIFGGITRLAPSLSPSFSAHSLTFNNTAGAFVFGGSSLTIGTGGVTNNDTTGQTFNNQVLLGADATFNAASGALNFGVVGIGGSTLTVAGASATNIISVSGTGGLIKNGSGTLSLQVLPGGAKAIAVNSGTLSLSGGTAIESLGDGSTLDINGGTFAVNKNFAVTGTAQGTLNTGGSLTFTSGRTLTMSAGGKFTLDGLAYTHSVGAHLAVTGAGSQLTGIGGATFALGAGGTFAVENGGVVSQLGSPKIGVGGTGTLTVTGAGSSFQGTGTATFGEDGAATVLFDQGAAGQFGSISLAKGSATAATGTLTIAGGSDVTTTSIFIGTGNQSAGTAGTVTVTGAGSSLTLNGNTSTIGSGNAGTVKVLAGGLLTSGGMTIPSAGLVEVDGAGTSFVATGDTAINGGQLLVGNGAQVVVAAGKAITVSNGGDAVFTGGDHIFTTAGIFNVAGSGSTFTNSAGGFSFKGGATVNLTANGSLTAASALDFAKATVTVSGSGTLLGNGLGSVSHWGHEGGATSVIFSNQSSATLGAVELGNHAALGTSGILQVQSSANVNVRSLTIGSAGGSGTGAVTVDGGTLAVSGPAGLTLGGATGLSSTISVLNNGTLAVPNGELRVLPTGSLTVDDGILSPAKLSIEGGTVSVNVIDALQAPAGGEIAVTQGGKLQFAGGFFSLTPVALHVAGSGSAITSPSKLHMLAGSSLTVQDGGDVTVAQFDLGSAFGPGSLSVDGVGSTLTTTLSSQWGSAGGSASVAFANGASGSFGSVSLPLGAGAATSSTLAISSGADVTMVGAFIGTGTSAGSSGIVSVTGPGSSLSLTNAVNSLVLGGASGTVGRLTVSDSALLGVAGATINTTGVLTIDGGIASVTGLAVNAGTIDLRAGSLGLTGLLTLTNTATGSILLNDTLTLGVTLANSSGGRIALGGNNAAISGGGTVQNSGLITGAGAIDVPVQNKAGGEIRAESGKTLVISSLSGANAGKIALQGGTVEFISPVTNGPTGQITGRGTLQFAGGLTNHGALQFSGGFTDVYGEVDQIGNGTVIVSGGATATFYGDVTHNGAEFRTSAGATSVFFGLVDGLGPFTGGGNTQFEGGYAPGNSPALVTLSPQITFTPANTLTMEIGGLNPGPGSTVTDDGHDKLIFTNAGTPMVTWGGTLTIDFINNFTPQPGQSFDLFDFDAARDAGQFAAINLIDPLPAGTALDYSQLYTTGQVLVVVPEPSTAALLCLTALGLACRRQRRAASSLSSCIHQ